MNLSIDEDLTPEQIAGKNSKSRKNTFQENKTA
ncbi:hypothetical protein Bhyg_09611 [Pseudolycoriella hygida]|uniref:Uncharacterized protein n=1 Tax=Pseudolycoriella hygida TaxID=35572 RepID=A0A9Q0N7K5_9DIPT|nr:hypothetical protein Bhyg_09611 [Pseudolycoriella hygida]